MDNKQSEKMICVDGHEISVSFTDTENSAVINQIKHILLSSFMANVSRSGDILAICSKQGDT